MSEVVAALRNITKAYPGVLACQQVNVEFFGGEIHALLGENGAGKSTIVKILAGLIKPDAGTVEIGGTAIRLSGPQASRGSGVGVVHQAGSLIATLTVEENLLIGQLYGYKGKDDLSNEKLRSKFRIDMKMDRLVRHLGPRERHLIEIYRLLSQNVKVLVLDEPTATLSPQESELLFQELRIIANAGYTVVVVSHKLPEVVANADRFTILRKGRVVASINRCEATTEKLTSLLNESDSRPAAEAKTQPNVASGQESFITRFHSVSTRRNSSHESPLCDLDLVLRRGEILGLAGRSGSGASTILDILYGNSTAITRGYIEWTTAEKKGFKPTVGFVPADRLESGAIAEMSVAENLALRHRKLFRWLGRKSNRGSLKNFAGALINRFDIHPPNPDLKLQNLSGGNIQKVLLAREIDYADDLLLAVNPTAGLDLASVGFVHRVLKEKAASGTGVVVHSDDIDEMVGLVDRIVVVSRGRIIEELLGSNITREAVGLALEEISQKQSPLETSTLRRVALSCAD
jgi:general nucleoside transport system ATP-binding protein